MKKQALINLLLLVVIVALWLVIWLDPFSEPEETPARLSTIDISKVNQIRLSRDNKPVFVLHKQGLAEQSFWHLTAPLEIPANPLKVDQLLGLLSTNSFRQYRIKSDNLAKLGLQQPGWEIAFASDTDRAIIYFGKTEGKVPLTSVLRPCPSLRCFLPGFMSL